ncbi:MAG: MATE family efflux transporter, partial [Actinomycetota bacterium]|nr:MATE family efflux transporter [Actinomycetota bacterium]
VGAGVGTGAVVLVLSPVIGRAFSPDPQVVSAAAGAFVVIAIAQWLSGYVFVVDGVLMGAGDTRWLAVAMVAALVVWAPLVLALSRSGAVLLGGAGSPVAGLWVWFGAGFMALRAVSLWWRFRGDGWAVTGAHR